MLSLSDRVLFLRGAPGAPGAPGGPGAPGAAADPGGAPAGAEMRSVGSDTLT